MIPARGRAVAVAGALAASVAGWVGPAAAPAAAYVCSSGIETPGRGSVVGSPAVRFTGPFDGRPSQAARELEVSFTSSPGPTPPTVRRTGSGVGSDTRFDVTVGNLSRNGQYTAQVRFIHRGIELLNCANDVEEQTAEVTFGVSVKARPPTNVRSSFDAGSRKAVVMWGASPDPDTARYTVTRKVGSADFEPVAALPGGTTSLTDTRLPGGAATITYAVSSSRNGPDPQTMSEASQAVAASPLGVPAPPSAPPSTTATTAGTTGPTTAPFVLDLPAGVTDPGAAPSPTGLDGVTPLPPGGDGGETGLPGPGAPQDRIQLPGGGSGSVGDGGDDGLPGLAYVAATLLSAAVAAHVLWRRGPILRSGPASVDTTLPVEPTPARVTPPAPPPIRPAATASRPAAGPPEPIPAAAAGKPILLIRAKGPSGPAERGPQGPSGPAERKPQGPRGS